MYNEIYAPITTLNTGYVYKNVDVVWHEALQGRNTDSIVHTIYTIMNMDERDFIYILGQLYEPNYSSLVDMVNQQTEPQQVTIRYLTKGHTHMSADSIDRKSYACRRIHR